MYHTVPILSVSPPQLIYAMSKHLPYLQSLTSLASLLISRQLADPESHSHAEKARYLGLTLLLALMLGTIQLAAGLLRMGWVVRFLSHAVVSGFSSGAAIILGG